MVIENFPHALRNISLYKRYKKWHGVPQLNFPDDIMMLGRTSEGPDMLELFGPYRHSDATVEQLKSYDMLMDRNLEEIASRWKIVSPDYCINCLGITKPDDSYCIKCGFGLLGDKKRVELVQTEKDNYTDPPFGIEDMKWTSKFSDDYIDSLAPSIGESQFEYRERLKWAFAENIDYKNRIKQEMDMALAAETASKSASKPGRSERETGAGGYCSRSCRYFYEEYLDDGGGLVADATGEVDYRCKLGYSTGGYCEYYEP